MAQKLAVEKAGRLAERSVDSMALKRVVVKADKRAAMSDGMMGG